MVDTVRDDITDWVNTLSLGVTAEAMDVPIIDREAIDDTKIIVSAASRTLVPRTRSTNDSDIEIDLAIAHPNGTDPANAAGIVKDAAQAIIDEAYGLSVDSGRVILIAQPIVIDLDYYRQQNVSLSVVRLTLRTY